MIDQKVQEYSNQLKELGISHEILEHPQLLTVADVQKYLGFELDDAIATLIMKADDSYIAIVRRSDTKVDFDRVKKLLAIKDLRRATDAEFEKLTGVPSGAAKLYNSGLKTVLDDKIFEKEFLNGGSGSLVFTFRYKTADLKKLPNFIVGNVTSPKIVGADENLSKFRQTTEALKVQGIKHEFIQHPPIKTVEEGLAYLGISPDQGVSTLIFTTDKGLISVLRRDDHQIDPEKVKSVTGTGKIRLCTAKEVLDLTGCQVGFVSPYNPEMKTVMDETIMEKDVVYLGTGSPEYDLKINPKQLIQLTNANPADVIQAGVARKKIRLLSGITPSGDGMLHIGNYLGAVRQFIHLAKAFDCFLMVADLHALTTVQNKESLQKNTEELILNELALLGDLTNITFFRQSDVPMHTELTWILDNVTPVGLLKRAHAYKDKLAKQIELDDINMGLFTYPILMASDILLYKADIVPVGKDQKQHVEITRDIADRFNRIFKKKEFILPEPFIPEEVAVVLGTDGKRKMSKSLGNIISIFEPDEVIKKQVMGTYTDPTRVHADSPGHIEGNMVFSYLDFFGQREKVDEFKKQYQQGKVGDVEVKNYLYESLLNYFAPARERYQDYKTNPDKVKKILSEGAGRARMVAGKTMDEVREIVGLTNNYSSFRY